MPIKVFPAWVDQTGHLVPATDNRRWDIDCSRCGKSSPDGVGRFGGEFLCDACLRELLRTNREDT
jgi:hypothetical protein